MLECLECGTGSTGSAMACARCGAPVAAQISVIADRAAGESADSAAPAGPGYQPPAKSRVLSAAWWAIGGGGAVFLGSLLPWVSVYVYDGNLFNAPNDPNLFQDVAVGNSISGGARAASAVFGLILIGLAISVQSASTRGVFVRPQAYAYGIPLIALSVFGIVGWGIFAVAGVLGFREADGLGIVGYHIFTLAEKHPILAEDGTAGSAHVSFTPNVGLIMILLGCTAAVIGAIRSLHDASPRPRRARHGRTHTFHLHPLRKGLVGGLCVAMGAFFLCFPIYGLFSPGFYKGSSALETAGTLLLGVLVALVCVWAAVRQFRNGAKVSGRKLTIRNEIRTYTVDAADIGAITLQPKSSPNGDYWVARVGLTSGKGIWIDNFDCGPAGKPPKPGRVAVVEEVRALLGVASDDLAHPESEAEAGDRNSMTTDHTDPADLSSLKDPRYSKPPQDDPVRGQVQAGEPELDDHGMPVQNRSAKRRIYLRAFACLICGAACFGLALTDYNGDARHRLTGYQTALAFLPGILAFVLAGFLEEKQLRVVGKGMTWAGLWLALFGMVGLGVFTWHWSA